MFEDYLLEVLVFLAGGWLGFCYTEKFLCLKEERVRALCCWLFCYTAGQFAWSRLEEYFLPQLQASIYGSMANLLFGAVLLAVLQRVFFGRNLPRQAFALLSFWAGWGILRFAVSPLAHVIFDWWNPLWQYLVEQSLIKTSIQNLIKIMGVQ